MKLTWYIGTSTAAAVAVIASAFHQRANFYSAMVYLAQSNFCLIILVNFVFMLYAGFFYALQRLCYGPLRQVETEQLYEKAWFAITETCLAMTIFRDEMGVGFLVRFSALITGKIWQWIGDGRVEILEQQTPPNPWLFHARLSGSLIASIVYDSLLLRHAIHTVIRQARPNMMVMFLFEFAVLTTSSLHTAARYLLNIADTLIVRRQTRQRLEERRRQVAREREEILRRRAAGDGGEAGDEEPPNPDDIDEMDIEVPGWEAKGQWVLSMDLAADSIKMITYLTFFCILLAFYGLPIHIMRDLFMTARAVLKRGKALLRYRRALNDMSKIPDATEEDLAHDNTCIICREEMRAWDPANNPSAVERTRPKKLRCGHILHLGCLKSWLERQQVCPMCRRSVVVRDRTQRGGQGNRNALVLRMGLGGAPQQAAAQPPGANGNVVAPAGQQPGNNNPPADNNAAQMQFFNLGPFRFGIGQAALGLGQGLGQANIPGVPPRGAPAQNGAAVPPVANNDAAVRARPRQAQAPVLAAGQRQEVPGEQPPAQAVPASLQMPLFRPGRRSGRSGTAQAGSWRGLPAGGLDSAAAYIREDLDDALNRIKGEMDELARLGAQASALRYIASLLALYNRQGQVVTGALRPANALRGAADLPNLSAIASQSLRPGGAIPAGSPDLPNGVVIPEGWSLMPLRRVDRAFPRMSSPAPRTPMPSAGSASQPADGAAPDQTTAAGGGGGGSGTEDSTARSSSTGVRRSAESIAAMNPSLSASEFLDRHLDEMLPYTGESGPFSLSGVGHNPRGRATDPAFPFLRNSPTNGELALALLSEAELGHMAALGDMPVGVATPALHAPGVASRWRERLTDRERAVIVEQNAVAANLLVDRLGHRLVLRLLLAHMQNAGHMWRAGPTGIVWNYVHWQTAQLSGWHAPMAPGPVSQQLQLFPGGVPTPSEAAHQAPQQAWTDPDLEATALALQRALVAANGGPAFEDLLRRTLPAGLNAILAGDAQPPQTTPPPQNPQSTSPVPPTRPPAGDSTPDGGPAASSGSGGSSIPRWGGSSQMFSFSAPETAAGAGSSSSNGGGGGGEVTRAAGPSKSSTGTTETAATPGGDGPSTEEKGKGKETAHAVTVEDAADDAD